MSLAVSPDPGRAGAQLELEELTSLLEMYGNAIDELVSLADPAIQPLVSDLTDLRASVLGALTQLGPSLAN